MKDRKKYINDEELNRIYDNCLMLLNNYKETGQTKAMRKLIFHLETIEKEREIIKKGINQFIYKDDITHYIEHVASETVKIIELKDYERDVPDDIRRKYSQVKDYFNKAYVVFTDYTGKIEKQVEKERRDKDPILFGTFQDETTGTVNERFYFIGDWEDEYCDLTLDKMVNEVIEKEDRQITYTISTPEDIESLKKQLSELDGEDNSFVRRQPELVIAKPTLIGRFKQLFRKGK